MASKGFSFFKGAWAIELDGGRHRSWGQIPLSKRNRQNVPSPSLLEKNGTKNECQSAAPPKTKSPKPRKKHHGEQETRYRMPYLYTLQAHTSVHMPCPRRHPNLRVSPAHLGLYPRPGTALQVPKQGRETHATSGLSFSELLLLLSTAATLATWASMTRLPPREMDQQSWREPDMPGMPAPTGMLLECGC